MKSQKSRIFFLRQGANPDSLDKESRRALHCAAINSNIVNNQGDYPPNVTPFDTWCALEILLEIIDSGADVSKLKSAQGSNMSSFGQSAGGIGCCSYSNESMLQYYFAKHEWIDSSSLCCRGKSPRYRAIHARITPSASTGEPTG